MFEDRMHSGIPTDGTKEFWPAEDTDKERCENGTDNLHRKARWKRKRRY